MENANRIEKVRMNTFKLRCIKEPRGDHGLEGYQLGELYEAKRIALDYGKIFWLVQPDPEMPHYYERVSVGVGAKYFQAVVYGV